MQNPPHLEEFIGHTQASSRGLAMHVERLFPIWLCMHLEADYGS